jgi:hypothetical protein
LSLIGWFLYTAYRLRRHLWLGWSLARWLGLLILAAGLAAVVYWWPHPWPAIPLGVLFLAYLILLAWAARKGYVHFSQATHPDNLFHHTGSAPPLPTDQMVPVRATGWFTVEGRDQYFVDVEADFETVGTREHIVLGRIHRSRFLLLGRWPGEELGWWYIFFQPAMIRHMAVGHLLCGPHPFLAMQVVYAPDEETQQTVYLAFDEASILHQVWHDLQLDAPRSTLPARSESG